MIWFPDTEQAGLPRGIVGKALRIQKRCQQRKFTEVEQDGLVLIKADGNWKTMLLPTVRVNLVEDETVREIWEVAPMLFGDAERVAGVNANS